MKILLGTLFFPPGHAGGTEAYTLGLAQTLQRVGHQPNVMCAEGWGQGDSWQPRHEDTTYDGLPVRRLYWNWQLGPNPYVNSYDNPAVETHFAAYLRELRPDVVHLTSCYSLSAAVIRAARRQDIPTFLTLTDFWFLCPRHTLRRGDGSLCPGPETALQCQQCVAWDSTVYRGLTAVLPADLAGRALLELSRWPRIARLRGLRGYVGDAERRLDYLRQAFDQLDLAIAPSELLRETFVRNGYPSDRIRVSRYGLETSWLARLRPRPPGARLRFGYLGQLEPIKGVDVLVRAFQRVSSELDAELSLHGSLTKNPSYAAELRRLAASNPRISFAGAFERPALAEVLSAVDVVVVPSVWYENAPVVIAEAFAAGKPVLATDLGGLSELVEHDVNGLLFGCGDEVGLADALRRLADPATRERLRRGIRPVRTIEQEVEELLALYRERSADLPGQLRGGPARVGRSHAADAGRRRL